MKYCTAGESHGPALTAIVSDVPAGFELHEEKINDDLKRRQGGYGRGGRMQIEQDRVEILSGVRFGKTLGTPIALRITNKDWENWSDRMALQGDAPSDLMLEQSPRPGHADFVGSLKIGTLDCRDVLERSSARETAARVAAGAVAKAWLANFGVEVSSYVTRIGDVEFSALPDGHNAACFSSEVIEASPVRCPDRATSARMVAAIDAAREVGESLGGWFVLIATGLVPGIGGYAEAKDRLTGRIGGAILSIPAIKGVEFGLGFAAGTLPGSMVHDPIISTRNTGGIKSAGSLGEPAVTSYNIDECACANHFGENGAECASSVASPGKITRASNNAGGLEGGMTTGEPLVIRAVMKPIPTLQKALKTIDLVTHEPREASRERSDVCAVPAAAVVAEAELAMVLADAYMDKFGHDCLVDAKHSFEHYAQRITSH